MPPASPPTATAARRQRIGSGSDSGRGLLVGGEQVQASAKLQQQITSNVAVACGPLETAVRALEQRLDGLSGELLELVERLEKLQGVAPRAPSATPTPRAAKLAAAAAGTGDSGSAYDAVEASSTSTHMLEQQLRELVGELRTLQQEQQRWQDIEAAAPGKQYQVLTAEATTTLRELSEERTNVEQMLDGVQREKLEVIALMHSFALSKDEVLQELDAVRRSVREESELLRGCGLAACGAAACGAAACGAAVPELASGGRAVSGVAVDLQAQRGLRGGPLLSPGLGDDIGGRAEARRAPMAQAHNSPPALAARQPLSAAAGGVQQSPMVVVSTTSDGAPGAQGGYYSHHAAHLPTSVAVSPILRTRSTVCDLRLVPSRPSIQATQVRRFASSEVPRAAVGAAPVMPPRPPSPQVAGFPGRMTVSMDGGVPARLVGLG